MQRLVLLLQRPNVSYSRLAKKGSGQTLLPRGCGEMNRGFSSNTTEPKERDLVMPTPLSLGFDITLQRASPESKVEASNRGNTIVVLCGWLGAKPRQLRVFTEWYHQKGFDVLSFAVGPKHVLFPKTAQQMMEKVINVASCPDESNPTSKSDRIIFHHFSVGGYLFGQMLRVLNQNQGKYSDFVPKIKAQIFDSPPDIAGVPAGIAASVGITNKVVAKGIELSVTAMLSALSQTTGVEHTAASKSFHNNFVRAPSLWFYSLADPVANHKDCDIVIGKWRQAGTTVETCVWENSKHIQHAKKDPVKYFGTLNDFLSRHNVL